MARALSVGAETGGASLTVIPAQAGIYRKNTPRCGFLGATGSLLPVCLRRTGGQAASGTHTESAFIKSISCRGVSTERDMLLPSTGSGQYSSALVMLEKFIVLILPSLALFHQGRGIFKRPFTVPRCLLGLRERDSERGKFAVMGEVTARAELVEACVRPTATSDRILICTRVGDKSCL